MSELPTRDEMLTREELEVHLRGCITEKLVVNQRSPNAIRRHIMNAESIEHKHAILVAFDALIARIVILEATCKVARGALESLPIDSLGVAYCAECAPDGEGDVMTWPIRDELVDKINRVLHTHKEATDDDATDSG